MPGYYQAFNLHSHYGPGKYSLEKAERILGYAPPGGVVGLAAEAGRARLTLGCHQDEPCDSRKD